MKGILARLRRKPKPKPEFPARDKVEILRQRALRVCNRDEAQAAVMLRKLVILAEGRKC